MTVTLYSRVVKAIAFHDNQLSTNFVNEFDHWCAANGLHAANTTKRDLNRFWRVEIGIVGVHISAMEALCDHVDDSVWFTNFVTYVLPLITQLRLPFTAR